MSTPELLKLGRNYERDGWPTGPTSEFYRYVPKDIHANLAFRQRIWQLSEDPAIQQELITICSRDMLFYINCIGAGTLVVTDRGPVPIECVTSDDLVWDGETWVKQGGPLIQGSRPVIVAYGITLTPDHKVWTTHGWQDASRGYVRQAIRLPNGSDAGGILPEHEKSTVAVSVRLREESSRARHFAEARRHEELRMFKDWEAHTRLQRYSAPQHLDDHAFEVPEPIEQVLQELRRSRNYGLRTMDDVRELFERHGKSAKGNDPRQDRQQRALQSSKLSMGNSEAAGQQYSAQHFNPDIEGCLLDDEIGGDDGNNLQRRAEKNRGWPARRRASDSEATTTAIVYDLINCGPRRAFTVISDDGTPLLVHNCFGYTLSPKDNPRCPVQPFITYEFQDRVLLQLQDSIGREDIAFPKSRDMGASWCCLLGLEHYWHFQEMQQFLLTSQVEELVDGKSEKALLRKLDFWWNHLPLWLQPKINRVIKSATNLDNGSRFNGQATVPNLARGDRPTAILKDESAEMPNASAIASATRDATNCRIDNSTPNGRFGDGKYFYDLVRNPRVRKIFLHWSEHPVKSIGLYKLRRRVVEPGNSGLKIDEFVGEMQIHQSRKTHGASLIVGALEKMPLNPKTYRWQDDYDFDRLRFKDGELPHSDWYDLQCSRDPNAKRIAKELNLDFEGSTEKLDNTGIMEQVRIEQCRSPLYTGEVLPSEESLHEGLQDLKAVWCAGAGFLEVWCDLIDGRPPKDEYSIGIDVSSGTGGTHTSQSVMSVWSNHLGTQVAEWRSNTISPDDLAIRAVVLAKWFWNALLIPEINGPAGTRHLRKIFACGYWNIFRRKGSEEEAVASETSKYGWFSARGAEGILRGLIGALANGEAKLRSSVCANQIEEYEWDAGKIVHKASKESDSESDKGAAHGDAAVAAGLGWLGVETANILSKDGTLPKDDEPLGEPPMNSVAWRRREKDRARDLDDNVVEAVW